MDELMRRCFSQRRKQMHKQLPDSPAWAEVAQRLGISPPPARRSWASASGWSSPMHTTPTLSTEPRSAG